jgi:hypothetical protein
MIRLPDRPEPVITYPAWSKAIDAFLEAMAAYASVDELDHVDVAHGLSAMYSTIGEYYTAKALKTYAKEKEDHQAWVREVANNKRYDSVMSSQRHALVKALKDAETALRNYDNGAT